MPKQDKPKKPKENSVVIAEPSKPVAEDKGKKEKNKMKIDSAQPLEPVNIHASGSISAGTWVAEMDTTNIRKSKLRTG